MTGKPPFNAASVDFNVVQDLTPPVITITVPSVAGLDIPVSWPADDGLSGIRSYEVQYKKDAAPTWNDWLTGTTAEQATFIGEPDSSYRFKVQATDNVGNVSEWVESEAVVVETVVKYYTFGSQRVALRRGDEVYYLSGDHLGSVSLTTNSAGDVVAESRYLPYGQVRWENGSAVTDFGFTSQRAEAGFGLMDYNARYYDPYLNRFISADTIVPEPGNPMALNRYMYVYGNPLRYDDPSGHGGPTDWLISLGQSSTIGETLVIGMAGAVNKANEYREDIFFPDADTTTWDRVEASTVIGGGATLVAATAAGGLALAGTEAVAAVSTSSATALVGSGTATTGNLIGQAVNKAATGESIDYGEVVAAGTTGYIAGAIAPFGATTLPGTAALGGVSATGQYSLVQLNSGNEITPEGVLLNATAGTALGALAGPVPPRASSSALPFDEFANNPGLRNRAIMEMYRGQMANTIARSSLARGTIGAIGSNLDWQKAQEECRQFGCP